MAKKKLKSRTLLSCALHELRAMAKLPADALLHSHETESTGEFGNALILPGFMAPSMVYNDLATFLNNNGIHTQIARYGRWVNLPNWRRQRRLLFENVERFINEFGSIDFVIGHSLGGLEAFYLVPRYPEIKKAIAICSPFSKYTPIVRFGASLGIAPRPVQDEILMEIKNGIKGHENKVITISTSYDTIIVPTYSARLPGVRNIIVNGRKVLKNLKSADGKNGEMVYQTHTGIVNSPYVREHILLPELRASV